jgi:hypothetical protein
MIIDEMTTTDKIEYYKKLLELERLTLAAVTEQRNETSHNLASIVAAILKRDGRDVFDMSAIDRLAELHTAERQRDEAVNDYETAVLREHRVQEQRDRLAEALREIDEARLDDFMGPHDMALKCVLIARESLAGVKGGSDECR